MRAFIAIEIDNAVKERLGSLAAQLNLKSVKAVPLDQIHITMAFLGDIDDKSAKQVGVMLSAMERSKFEISFTGIGTFSRRKPNVIFAKVLEGDDDLGLMSSYINDGLKALRLEAEYRKFTAHATIARVKSPGNDEIDAINSFVAAHAGDQLGSFICTCIKLKGSTLTQKGPIYKDLFSSSFGL